MTTICLRSYNFEIMKYGASIPGLPYILLRLLHKLIEYVQIYNIQVKVQNRKLAACKMKNILD